MLQTVNQWWLGVTFFPPFFLFKEDFWLQGPSSSVNVRVTQFVPPIVPEDIHVPRICHVAFWLWALYMLSRGGKYAFSKSNYFDSSNT
jgi:hypothetical protein